MSAPDLPGLVWRGTAIIGLRDVESCVVLQPFPRAAIRKDGEWTEVHGEDAARVFSEWGLAERARADAAELLRRST